MNTDLTPYNVLNTDLNSKIKKFFPFESVLKDPAIYSVFSGYNLPSYIKDWLVKCFTKDDVFDSESCLKFIEVVIPGNRISLRKRLLTSKHPIQIFTRMLVNADLSQGKICFSIPDLGIRKKEGVVSQDLPQQQIDMLKEGEVWGVLKLSYIPPYCGEKGYVELTDFRSFEPYQVDLDYYRNARKEFTTLEWIDLLIRSMEVNPDYSNPATNSSFTVNKKLTMLSRLLVHVEPNLNMIELAPKGTGKSFVFNNLSKFGWTVSGGFVSRAGLFYNLNTHTPGIIHNYDFLAIDEVETVRFANDDDILGAFKNYLENGKIVVGDYSKVSECGLIFLGNIALDRHLHPKNTDFFVNLPDFFHSSALIDRIHGFIPGWILFRFAEGLKLKGYALNIEYFSEILHLLRQQSIYGQLVQEALHIPQHSDTRDTKAVVKICTALMKLLYPHARSLSDIPENEFRDFIFTPAMRSRAIIRQQLSVLDSEYIPKMPDIKLRGALK